MSSAVMSDVSRHANGESKYPSSSSNELHASSTDDVSSVDNHHADDTNYPDREHLRPPYLNSPPSSTSRLSSGPNSMLDGVKRKFARLYTHSPSCTSLVSQSGAGNLANLAGNKSAISVLSSKSVANSYNVAVDKLRKAEYPDLAGRAYLDNAGTQLPAKSLLSAFAKDLSSNLYGNPHTNSFPARNSSARVEAVRKRVLDFFHADPEQFDIIFVANATAALKLVGEAMHDYVSRNNENPENEKSQTLWYGYHKDAHNSVIGIREFTENNSRSFVNDAEVEEWIQTELIPGSEDTEQIGLFAYPGQSNMTGRRLPLTWPKDIRVKNRKMFTMLDAAALSTTKQLELNDWQPDFTAVSFYKIFGYPDLGALIVRKPASYVLTKKKYFGGGTVDFVLALEKPWMYRRTPLHQQLEEGTLPFHSIIALGHALDVHKKLFTSMDRISSHVCFLTRYCYNLLEGLVYSTGQPLCEIYQSEGSTFGDPSTHGGTIAFNLYRSDGSMIGHITVEKAADEAGIFVRSGGMCNPGGVQTVLNWTTEKLEQAFSAGMRCTKPIEVYDGSWSGVIRVSFGANSIKADVDRLIKFLKKTYLHGPEGQPKSTTR